MPDTIPSDSQERLLKNSYLKVTIANEQQTVTIIGTPTGGTFKLAWEGSGWSGTIAYNADASVVKTALEALSTIGNGNVDVSGSAGGPYTVIFQGTLAATPCPLLTKDATGLTGGSSPNVTIAQSVAGVGTPPRYYYLGLSQSTRATLTDDAVMSAINEVTGTGYARHRLKTDGTDIVISKVAGFWRIKSKICTFAATAADWVAANSVFITDKPDNTGKVMGLKTISAFTLGNGNTQDVDYTNSGADAAA